MSGVRRSPRSHERVVGGRPTLRGRESDASLRTDMMRTCALLTVAVPCALAFGFPVAVDKGDPAKAIFAAPRPATEALRVGRPMVFRKKARRILTLVSSTPMGSSGDEGDPTTPQSPSKKQTTPGLVAILSALPGANLVPSRCCGLLLFEASYFISLLWQERLTLSCRREIFFPASGAARIVPYPHG